MGKSKTKRAPIDNAKLVEKMEAELKAKQNRNLDTRIDKQYIQQSLLVCDGDQKAKYRMFNQLSTFTVNDLNVFTNLQAIDMSQNLNPAIDFSNVYTTVIRHMNEEDIKFRIYMRDSINYGNFVRLQQLVETMYLEKPLEELQGWIIHCGYIFIIGSVHLTLENSSKRIKEAIIAVTASQEKAREDQINAVFF